jgi:hypothetical protein
MLERSRRHLEENGHQTAGQIEADGSARYVSFREDNPESEQINRSDVGLKPVENVGRPSQRSVSGVNELPVVTSQNFQGRKPISEVLQDIYDDKIQ